MIKNCPICTKDFETEKEKQIFCSGACLAKSRLLKAIEKRKKHKPAKRVKKLKPDTISHHTDKVAEEAKEFFGNNLIEEKMPAYSPIELGKALDIYKETGQMPTIKTVTPWIAAIEAYCEEEGLIPQDLIDFHKGHKPKKEKPRDPVLSYFEQRQKRQAFGE